MKFLNCLVASAAICGAGVFLLQGRLGHPDLPKLRNWNYAHRGLHGDGRPENSMAAFRAALDHGYGIELDIHLLKDGNLAVIHDSLLKRTTGLDGRIEDLTTGELKNCRLEGTEETIPTFREVLELFAGKAPLIVELKPEAGNHAALCQAACDLLAGYDGLYCMESFDPRCVAWLKKNRPQIIRGQLSMYSVDLKTPVPLPLRFALTHNLLNFYTRPDFLAYNYHHRRRSCTNFICEKLLGVQGVTWTLKTPEEHADALKQGLIPIFENYIP
jgi:glycerophosphoryl diester phosphodiesterase